MRLEIFNDTKLIPGAAQLITQIAMDRGLAEDKVGALEVFLKRFISQRMQKADPRFPELVLEVPKADDTSNQLRVMITDKWKPYYLKESDRETICEEIQADHVDFEELLYQGQRLSLIYKISAKDIPSDEPVYERDVLLDKDFTCRQTLNDEEDILKAWHCIYSHYGFNYLHQDLYRMDYFKEIMANGRYVAAVAENKSGQVMGFGALDGHPWFPGLMEMGGLVVNPIARGLGLGDALDDYRIEIGKGLGIRGLFSTPIMPNPASQKLLTRHGYIATGMYFHAGGPASLGGSGDGIHPMDCGFCVYIYDKDLEHVIYVPEECKEFIKDTYDEVGLKYLMADDKAASDPDGKTPDEQAAEAHPEKTTVFYNHEVTQDLLEVKFNEIGQDYRDCVEALPLNSGFNGKNIDAILLFLNMNDPLCQECYEYCRERGFIFTGCVPGGDMDLLIVQYLKYTIDRDYIQAEPNYAEIIDRLYEINGDDMRK